MNIVFSDFLNSNVLIVGDIILDRYCYGSIDRISSESSVPIVDINKVVNRPGGAANVAMNIAALGGRSMLIGFTGMDEAAEILKEQLVMSKVIVDFISFDTYSTIIKLRVMSRNQQIIRLDFEKRINKIDYTRLISKVKLHLLNYNVLVLSDYLKGSLNKIEEIITLARSANIPIIVDPKGTQFSRYKGATLLTPNMSEFESVVGFCSNESIIIGRAKEVISDYNLSALLITRSEAGMTLVQKHADPLYFSSKSKEVYDVIGAGDTVIGVLSAALSSGFSLEKACFLANKAAGVVIGKIGTSTVNESEIKSIMEEYKYSNIPLGILNEDVLKNVVSLVRARGEKIVMTNGVFDILHYGHISYLNSAKKLGSRLIVAVNSDKSVKRLKGKNRPINSLEKRMSVLSVLSMVDWVVPFYEDTPVRLISEISPDVLVKGGDYALCNVDGYQEVINKGGIVHVVKFEPDCSSSSIISAMSNNQNLSDI